MAARVARAPPREVCDVSPARPSQGYGYATPGEVVDVAQMQKFGTIPATGIVWPNAANARVHFLNGNTIRSFHNTTHSLIGNRTHAMLARVGNVTLC